MRAELGFLAGLGAGVTVGLLFAPKSGKQTKHFIAQKVRSGMDQVSAAGKKLLAQAVSLTDEVRERVKEVVEAGKEAYRAAV
jgi:gas vesicle protein